MCLHVKKLAAFADSGVQAEATKVDIWAHFTWDNYTLDINQIRAFIVAIYNLARKKSQISPKEILKPRPSVTVLRKKHYMQGHSGLWGVGPQAPLAFEI